MLRILLAVATALISPTVLAAVVLQYHHVSNTTPAITSISPDDFAAHMAYLHDNQFNVVSIESLFDTLGSDRVLPDKTVVITFDDAYLDILENAMPILAKYQFPSTIFVATELVGSSTQYLNWQQLQYLYANGVTIANHTVSHTHLLRMQENETEQVWRKRVQAEILDAQTTLANHIGETPKVFAYPYGEYNAAVVHIIDELGYVAFGQQSGAIDHGSNKTFLPRYALSGIYTDIETFKTKLMTLPLPTTDEFIEPLLESNVARPPLHLKLKNTDLSLHNLVCYGPAGQTHIDFHSPQEITATTTADVPVGRSRYNCTKRHKSGRYYWFSQPWIRKNPDGTWYPEP